MEVKGRRIPTLATPFANDDMLLDYSFYEKGITPEMSTPVKAGGTPFTHHMMNGIGYLATLGTFLWQQGYPFSQYDISRATAFGGYPKGAVIYTITEEGMVLEYESKTDNNLSPLPPLESGVPKEDDNWRPLYEVTQVFPGAKFASPSQTISTTINNTNIVNNSFSVSMDISSPSMVTITRTIKRLDSISKVELLYGIPILEITASYEDSSSVTIGELPVSLGRSASISIPMSDGKISFKSNSYNYDVYGDMEVSLTAYPIEM